MAMQYEKKVLIVEDEDAIVKDMLKILPLEGLKYRSERSCEGAIRALESFFPDVVLLDLCILEKNLSKDGDDAVVVDKEFGMRVFNDIVRFNSAQQRDIRVVLVSANVRDAITKELAKAHPFIVAVVDKGSESFYDDLLSALDEALKRSEKPVTSKSIAYKGFSREVLESLKRKDGFLYNHLSNNILSEFQKKQYTDVILAAYEFATCILEVMRDGEFNTKEFWKGQNKLSIQDGHGDFLLGELVGNNKIRDLDKKYFLLLRFSRNQYAHKSHKSPNMDDAATALQLLVSIVRRYIEQDS